jgi:dienelactone hydrolase
LPESNQRLPTVLFSHGLGGSRGGGLEWGEQWASRGFAVIHVQHPGSDESLWKDKPAGERWTGLRSGASVEQFLARIADIKFVVAELGRRQAAGDALTAAMDLDRLGMSGHSFGAITALYLGGQRPPVAVPDVLGGNFSEPRFKAFLAFSPQATGSDAVREFSRFARPALLVTGTLDGRPFGGLGSATPAQRLVPFDAMASTGNKFQLVVEHADHMFFNGTRGLRDFSTAGREGIDFTAVEQRGYRLVKAVSTAYWLAYLAGDDRAMGWLKDGDAAALAASDGVLRVK